MTKSINYTRLASRWTRSIFLWDDHQAAISVLSLDFEDSSRCTEAVTNDTRRAVNDSFQSISLSGMQLVYMRKYVLQNYIMLDVLTPAKGRTYVIIKTQCCVYIPDNAADISLSEPHMSRYASCQTPNFLFPSGYHHGLCLGEYGDNSYSLSFVLYLL